MTITSTTTPSAVATATAAEISAAASSSSASSSRAAAAAAAAAAVVVASSSAASYPKPQGDSRFFAPRSKKGTSKNTVTPTTFYIPRGLINHSLASELKTVILEANPTIRPEDFEFVFRWIQDMRTNNKNITIPSDFKWCYYTGSSMYVLKRISEHIVPGSSDIFADNINKGNVGHVQACRFCVSFPVDEECMIVIISFFLCIFLFIL